MVASACESTRENPGEIRIPLTAPVHLQPEDIVVHAPYREFEEQELEGRNVSPQLKMLLDDLCRRDLPALALSSRPYALTFQVDQSLEHLSTDELEAAIDQVEACVYDYFPPVKGDAFAIHGHITSSGAFD